MNWVENAIANLYDIVPARFSRFVRVVALGLRGELGVNDAMIKAAREGHIEIVKLHKEWGATYFDEAMREAAEGGHVEIVKLCKEWGATNFDWAMIKAASGGHIEIMELCKEWGATNFDWAMREAAKGGHVEVIELCKEWGATDFNRAMSNAVLRSHVEIVKLCREWLGFSLIHDELFRYHHKREFSKRIHEELLPIAWHPDRVWDWCFDEGEKGFLEKMFKS